jgi:integrase
MSLYKRKGSETYTADFEYRTVRVSQDTGCKSKTEARQWQQAKKQEIDRNLPASLLSTHSRLTLEEAGKLFVEEHLQFADGYVKSEQYRFPRVIKRLGPKKRLEDLSTADVKKYVASRQAEGIAPATINREINNIRALWGHAMDIWEYPVKAIAWRRIRPEIPERLPPQLNMADIRRLLAAATPRLAKVIMFALMTGFRHHEIKKLAPKNVNFEKLTIRIIGKGNKEAQVPMSSATASMLLSGWDEQSSKVFDLTNYREEWDDARAKADLKHLHFHDLRHAFATTLSEMNAPIQHISKLGLRHSDIDTTLIYDHAGAQALSPFLEKLGNNLLEGLQDK